MVTSASTRLRRSGAVAGPALFLAALAFGPRWMPDAAAAALAATLWIAAWWITEPIPIPATSLLPLALFPVLGVGSIDEAARPYANPVIYLFLGGFLLAIALERWDVHRRVARAVVGAVGDRPRRLLLGLMAATAFLSMWVSNTATTLMMIPVAAAVVGVEVGGRAGDAADADSSGLDADGDAQSRRPPYARAVLLGVAYAATVGGLATPIGTPPNAILLGVARERLGVDVAFVDWMLLATPLAVALLVATWGVLALVFRDGIADASVEPSTGLGDGAAATDRVTGPLSSGQRRVVAVFALVALGWLTRPFLLEPVVPGVSDAGIAVAGAVLLFLAPSGEDGRLLDWEDARDVPWGVLLLFGAGFSLASAFQRTGFDAWVAGRIAELPALPAPILLAAVLSGLVLLGEIASNTASAALFVPLAGASAATLGFAELPLMVAVALGASVGFVLPVATPPNAVAYGTGAITTRDMARAGVWIDAIGIGFVVATALLWLPVVL